MVGMVTRQITSRSNSAFFSILCDDYTDISNKEQLTLLIRWVDEELEAHEDFLGFVNIPNICSDTILAASKTCLSDLAYLLVTCTGNAMMVVVPCLEANLAWELESCRCILKPTLLTVMATQ